MTQRATQFYWVHYKTRLRGFNKFASHNAYERGRANLMKLINECLADKKVSEFTVHPVSREVVPLHFLSELEKEVK